jgi:hypothetical protein
MPAVKPLLARPGKSRGWIHSPAPPTLLAGFDNGITPCWGRECRSGAPGTTRPIGNLCELRGADVDRLVIGIMRLITDFNDLKIRDSSLDTTALSGSLISFPLPAFRRTPFVRD